jgi:hypothetical protein
MRTKNAPGVACWDHLEWGGFKNVPKDEKVGIEKARHLRHGYDACISDVDAQVGKLPDALKQLGLKRRLTMRSELCTNTRRPGCVYHRRIGVCAMPQAQIGWGLCEYMARMGMESPEG